MKRRPTNRRGVAAAEAAFCIPVVLLLTFATLEICNTIFLKETVTIAAYEGARIGVRKDATSADVRNRVNSVLQARGLSPQNANDFQITITPNNNNGAQALDPVSVRVVIPVPGYIPFVGDFFASNRVGATVVMAREFDD